MRAKEHDEVARLREQLERVERLGGIGIWEWDIKRETLRWSPAVYRLFGVDPTTFELTFDNIVARIHPEDRAHNARHVEKVLTSANTDQIELRVVRPNGEIRWVKQSVEIERDNDGSPSMAIGSMQDITVSEELQEQLGRGEARYRRLYERAPAMVYSIDAQHRLVMVSDYWLKCMGYERDEVLGREVVGFLTEESRQATLTTHFPEYERKGWTRDVPPQMVKKDGTVIDVLLSAVAETETESRIERSYSVITDVSDRKRAEEELHRGKVLLESSIESAGDMIILSLDRDYRYLYFNRAHDKSMRAVYGARPQIGDCIFDHMRGQGDIETIKSHYDRALAGENHVATEKIGEGRLRYYYEIRFNPMYDENGSIIGLTVFADNITDRKRTEEALRESKESLDRMFNFADYMACIADLQRGFFTKVSPAFTRHLGWSTEEMQSKPILDFVHPDDVEKTANIIKEQIEQGLDVIKFENRYRTKNGDFRWFEWAANPVPAEGITYSVAYDITERKQAEAERGRLQAELMQTRKMEAVGTLAGGIAHDMNNVLAVIMGLASLLEKDTNPNEARHQDLKEIVSAAQRGKALVDNLLGFARKRQFACRVIDLNACVCELLTFLERTLPKKIRVETNLCPTSDGVRCDPSQVSQAILNVCLNARDAIADAGTIRITTTQKQLTEKNSPRLEPGKYIVLQVVDDGCGMDEVTLTRAMDPFFTTKDVGKGTGLGLAMAHGVVDALGGDVRIESRPHCGTTVALWFPAVEAEAWAHPQEQRAKATPELRRDDERMAKLLLVDDEAMIRNAGKRMLEASGYEVLIADDGFSGAETYRERADDIDIVILDLSMPVMDGAECFENLRQINPGVRVLLCSGHGRSDAAQELIASGALGLVRKPFELDQLCAAIEEAMQSTPPT